MNQKKILTAGLIISLLFFSSFLNAEVIEKIIAIVDDEIITLSDLESYRQKIKTGKLSDDLLKPNKQNLLSNNNELIDYIINEKILTAEVKKNNLTVTIERLEQEIRKITQQNQLTRQQLKTALAKEGIEFSTYQDFIKTRLERQSLVEKEISSKVKISDDDILSYYLLQKGNASKKTFEYSVNHIFFSTTKGSDERAYRTAQSVLSKLKEGQPFEDLANQYSEDSNLGTGGFLGVFKSGEMVPELEGPITQLDVNQFSEIVKSKRGYHILKLLKKTIVADPQFLKEKTSIYNHLFQINFEKEFNTWLNFKRQQAFIRKNNY